MYRTYLHLSKKFGLVSSTVMVVVCLSLIGELAWSQNATTKYSADVPPFITTPDSVDTRIGTLKFHNGAPDEQTVKALYDQLDFSRSIQAFLTGMPATSILAVCEGLDRAGIKTNQAIGITEDLMDARSLFLTPNTTTVYFFSCINLNDGPIVVQVPPRVLGAADDAYFRWVSDVGLTGPDRGKGGKYLFVSPGYQGVLPSEGYFVAKSRTNRIVIFARAFVEGGDIGAAVRDVKANANIYPLSKVANPPPGALVQQELEAGGCRTR